GRAACPRDCCTDVCSANLGQVLSVTGLTADHGTAVQNINGSWTITPDANYNGTVTLSYSVTDSNGSTVAASQSFTLDAVNDVVTDRKSVVQGKRIEDDGQP